MPCMGPVWDDNLPKEITEDILKLLKEKYRLNNNGLEKPNDGYDFDDDLKSQLYAVIHDIVQSNAFNGF